MPPAAKRDCGLILFDIASPKTGELLNGLLKFAAYKWFMNSKSVYRLILINTSETKNVKDYPNIYKTDLDELDPKMILEVIENATPSDGSNWLDAMKLAIHHLEEATNMKGLVTLQLIFFTTLNYSVTQGDEASAHVVTQSLNKNDIFLYFIGPDVALPFTITSQESIPKCMKDMSVNKSQVAVVLAHQIVSGTKNSIICNTRVGINVLISYKYSPGSQEWHVPITFGSNLSLPVFTSKGCRKDTCLKLHDPVPRNYIKTLADNREVKVDEADIVKGILRHGKFLKMDGVEFKVETERCFDIIGFTDKKLIPETYLQGEDTFYVLPSNTNSEAFQIFTHLVKILAETDKYAVSKRVYAANNKARYFAMIPQLDFQPKCFIMTGLPYSGFMIPHRSEIPIAPKEEVEQDDFHEFFRSLIIESKDSKADITLGPTMMLDIHQQKIVNSATKKYTQREDLDLEILDINDYETTTNNQFLENIKASWPERIMDLPSTD